MLGWAVVALLAAGTAQEDLSSAVDEIVRKRLEPDGPGAAVLVVRDGKVVHRKGYGLANLEHRVPVAPETVFDLASVSKQFTATAVMILADRGLLGFEDDARKVLPELPEYDPERPIRVRDLLHHTSGLKDYLNLLPSVKGDPDRMKNEDVLKLLAGEKLAFRTGSKWSYSNSNYCLLALTVERLTKKTFAAVLQEGIFGPLGMKNAHVLDDVRKVIPHRAYGYGRSGKDWAYRHSDLVMTGDGAVLLSIDDYALWDAALREGKLVKPETLKRAFAPGALDDGKEHSYGFGWGLGAIGGRAIREHSGGWVGFSTYALRTADDRLTVAVFSNQNSAFNPQGVARAVAKLFLDAK